MAYELTEQGLRFESGRAVPLTYKGVRLKSRFYIDYVIEDLVVVELKSVPGLAEIHTRQLLTQLTLADLPVGLLMNFNVVTLTDGGINRVINRKAGRSHPAVGG
jgi:GxxExxY protein